METVRGENNLLLTCRRVGGGVTVARVRTSDAAVVLPERLWGLPVTALGDHAFTPGAGETEGEQVRVVSGGDGGAGDNENLTEVTLPAAIEQVGNYAFYNCTALRTLRLAGHGIRWGGSVLMNCRALDTFFLTWDGRRAGTLRYVADELSRELDVTLRGADGAEGRFLFPEYRENYEENAPAHHFDYVLTGAGYPYHHCFRGEEFLPGDFDRLWEMLLRTEHDELCALRLAWWRLRCPLGLEQGDGRRYLAYLCARAEAVLEWLVERGGGDLAWFLQAAQPTRQALRSACALARERGAAQAQALLLEAEHRRFPAGGDDPFAL